MMRRPTFRPAVDAKPAVDAGFAVDAKPAESLILREARPFTMPDSRFEAFGSGGGKLIAVLLCLMLASAALLLCFAIVPQRDAGAATVPEETVAQKISDAGSAALAEEEANDRDAASEEEAAEHHADAKEEGDAAHAGAQQDEEPGRKSGAEKLDRARTVLSLG